MDIDILQKATQLGLFMVPFLFALCFHEFAHGWVAKRKGDNTAEMLGRLSLNPVVHADIVGTLIVPTLAVLFNWPFFGWAKPVPVNTRNLKDVKNDMFWIAAAGPLSNILLAIVGAMAYRAMLQYGLHVSFAPPMIAMLRFFVIINLFLAVFNLLPIHPLDGGKILARFLPEKANRFLEENQMITSYVLILLAFTGGLVFIAYPVQFVASLLVPSIGM